jgi:hypothetical protein
MWRDGTTNALIAEIEGQRLTKENVLTDEQHAGLFTLLVDLQTWLEVEVDMEIDDTHPARHSGLAVSGKDDIDVSPLSETKDKKGFSPLETFTKALETDAMPPVDPGLVSIIGLIDEVLQDLLKASMYHKRGIRLIEGPKGGMVIEVGLDTYDSLDTIPDEGIREIIRSAVERWESSSS